MTRFICVQCGTQFAETPAPPPSCPICEDERQYVRWSGQEWTTVEELRTKHRNVFTEEGGPIGIGIEPDFAIGQRALAIPTGDGAILWDCVSLVKEEAVERIRRMGGLKAIAISHPHFYSAMAEWSEAFGGAPVYLHEDDRSWVMNPHGAIRFWSGETLEIAPGFTLIRTGGHFEGSAVLHHAAGADGGGDLFVGDTLSVLQDRRHVSFMRSYPNFIPLNRSAVERIGAALAPYPFQRIFGASAHRNILQDGKAALVRSVERYLRAIRD
ncbi:MBL fold metallo-hydrolase [Microvirga arsenatis]|uniref:MBL fold metallo-hydrolase n=1 Tax=Microvirga arsenatis TaxID=2692265 RepID=A0ABW9YXA3_9HYPH|nr:MBL fold metallo-hydrolase [Microvirga arsenatis]NBJ10286.1 MBL fold metallo-hydrolase [Microvirga arsenatis]NBJ24815.1 MBL fold metallo-hydrolase [Microvirga arsenatis]